MIVSTDKMRSIIRDIATVMEEQKLYLSDLDQAIGDGDHGFNMARGFGAVLQKLKETPGTDMGDLLKTVAMALISNVGGAAGPLYGSMFLKASTAAKGLTEIDLHGFVPLFKEGVLAIQSRGNAEPGDKTMIDVLLPAAESLERDCAAGLSARNAFANAERVAADCLEKTKDIVAKKGRASYLGERSIGHVDPGAASSYLMIRTICNSLLKEEDCRP
ncbi:MAG: dihydroxyacetone kinase subunit DhaL [Treponema sp.]|nr:dihydroxyacetone kinase subunit DhaL [Treponema sp.]